MIPVLLYSLVHHYLYALNGPDFASYYRHVVALIPRQLTDYR
jgi:hypothetical protein